MIKILKNKMCLGEKVEHKSLNSPGGYSVPTTAAAAPPQLLHFNLVEYLGGALSAGSVFQLGD